jgi:hypothetical protein
MTPGLKEPGSSPFDPEELKVALKGIVSRDEYYKIKSVAVLFVPYVRLWFSNFLKRIL